jgi:NADPH:quinone reductase-like Zn-dependent oxidoreductase
MTVVETLGAARDATRASSMKAIVQDRYGSPDVLRLRDVDIPTIGADGVLVRVRASSVNAAEWHTTRGRPYFGRAMMGLRRPKQPIAGTDVAGIVEAVGADVTELRPGDEVFGARNGAYAEYVAGRVRNFVSKPANLSFEEAAAVPIAGITALQGLRDQGRVQAGQEVLVIGAGGGVGTFTVQLAKAFGASVTAVTGTASLELVRSLGAEEAVDRTVTDITRSGRRFDVIVDVGGYESSGAIARVLAPAGTAVLLGAGDATSFDIISGMLLANLRGRLLGQRMRIFLARFNRDDLLHLAELVGEGRLRPAVDRIYPLADTAAAMRYAETGQARGKVVITVSS